MHILAETKPEVLKILPTLVGQRVSLLNLNERENECQRMRIHVHGVLEGPEDPDGNYYCRIADTFEGSSGIAFCATHVIEIEQITYGHRITIK